jgi:hypothetical protein
MKSGMTRASTGTIWMISTITRTDVRNRKRNRATATAASSASRAPASTVASATVSEFARYRPKPPSVMT